MDSQDVPIPKKTRKHVPSHCMTVARCSSSLYATCSLHIGLVLCHVLVVISWCLLLQPLHLTQTSDQEAAKESAKYIKHPGLLYTVLFTADLIVLYSQPSLKRVSHEDKLWYIIRVCRILELGPKEMQHLSIYFPAYCHPCPAPRSRCSIHWTYSIALVWTLHCWR